MYMGLEFILQDDKIQVIAFKNSITRSKMIEELNSSKYQKKYIREMYNTFGEQYKEHYKKLTEEKINTLKDSLDDLTMLK